MAIDKSIHFFKEGVKFRLNNQSKLLHWLKATAKKESYKIQTLNFIFCSDDYLLEMNKNYLKHNYFTDIITFDNSIEKKIIEGDIFISIDTVSTNAKRFETGFDNELHRVMIHGLLHLLGHKDKTEKDKKKMRALEDKYLSQF